MKSWLGIGAAALIALTGCAGGGNNTTSTQKSVGGVLTIDNESGKNWDCDFNPYNGSVNGQSFGIIYETLVYDNLLNDQKTNWLASDYKWGSDSKSITFTIRPGVKWTDGQDFTADDVVFSFNLLKDHPDADLQSVWAVLSSVTKQGSNQVVMAFQQTAVPNFYQIAGQTAIVPQHIWSTYKDPATQVVNNPVGTGPFTMNTCTGQNVNYKRNPNYWQKGLPYLDQVNYPAFLDNDPANAFLAAGQAQWGGQFIPNIDTYYVGKDPKNNHYWFPPIQNINIWFNFTKAPLDNKFVRQAMAFGIDRASVSQKGEFGYEPAGNQTGVLSPTFDGWIDKSLTDRFGYKFDVNKAQSLLTSNGFTKGSDGIFKDASGKRLSFSIINIAGYTDWVASVQVVQDNLKQVGIEIKPQNLDASAYFDKLFSGNFDLAYGSLNTSPGPNPYYELRNTLDSATSAAIGQTAAGDYGRYKNTAVDGLFDQFGATTDSAKQHDLIKQVENAMLDDVPVIPVTEGVAWYQYSTKDFAGWPTKDNPYAAPAPWNLPDWEVTLIHVYKKS